jgi:spore maturation protein CgeB
MRTFEVPGIGGIMLTQSSEENSIFFNGDEVNEFDSALDCARKAAVLMEMGEEEALAMRHRARTKSLQSGYTYKARAETVGKIFDRIA